MVELRTKAEKGDAQSQYDLGIYYAIGERLPQDLSEAVKWYRKSAEQGFAKAQYNLGMCYTEGKGVLKDMDEAVKWYRKGAEQGDAQSQYNLGVCYALGAGVSMDEEAAFQMFRKAAEQGYDNAQYNLSIYYLNGKGVSRNVMEGAQWCRKAAEQGNAKAQARLSSLYAAGDGVGKDMAEAEKWLRKAADQGYAEAQFNLGIGLATGEGMPKDAIEAYKWFNLSAAQGNERAARNRDISERGMSSDQIAEAQRRSRDWKPIMAQKTNESPAPVADTTLTREEERLIAEARELYDRFARGQTNLKAAPTQVAAAYEKFYNECKKNRGGGHPVTQRASGQIIRMFGSCWDIENEAKWALVRHQDLVEFFEKAGKWMPEDRCLALGELILILSKTNKAGEASRYVMEALPLFNDPRVENVINGKGEKIRILLESYHEGLFGIGRYYQYIGDQAAAEIWLKRSLQYAKQHTFKTHAYEVSARALADVYENIHDYQRAEPLRLDAYECGYKMFGDAHVDSITDLRCLGWNYYRQGRSAEAEGCMRKSYMLAQAIFPGSNLVTEGAGALAGVLLDKNRPDDAAELYRIALSGYEKDGKLWQAAAIHLNLGVILFGQMKLGEAEQDFQKAIDIYDQLDNRANDEGRDVVLRQLAWLQCLDGRHDKAQEVARRWMQGFDERLSRVLSFTDEDQRMAWLQRQRPCDLTANLNMPEETAQMLLRTKGIVLESIMEDRAFARKNVKDGAQDQWAALLYVRDQLRQALASPAGKNTAEILKLETRESELQKALAGAGVKAGQLRASLKSSLQDLQSALPEGSVFLDYFRYTYAKALSIESTGRYGVVLHCPGQKPKLFCIEQSAEEMDRRISLFLNTMSKVDLSPRSKDESLEILMKYFFTSLIAPLEKELEGVHTLILSTDQQLNFLPFATLMNDRGTFLCERFNLRQINSARDLVRGKTEDSQLVPNTFSLYGGANYRLDNHEASSPVSGGLLGYIEQMIKEKRTILPPLPGSLREVQLLAKRAEKAGWQTDLNQGGAATESSIRKIQSPGVLHISTHGYFIERTLDEKTENAARLTVFDGSIQRVRTLFDPMKRSGVFLAGAENSFEQWKQGKSFPLDTDGVLTAAEASTLDLHNTWLVALSACDTGAGDSVSGEGVLGLRRAFSYAGARNVMMSLWPIYDEATVQFTDDFYDKALTTHDAASALNETQREWLTRVKKKLGLWEAIKRGGAFIIVGMGR